MLLSYLGGRSKYQALNTQSDIFVVQLHYNATEVHQMQS